MARQDDWEDLGEEIPNEEGVELEATFWNVGGISIFAKDSKSAKIESKLACNLRTSEVFTGK